MIEILSIISQFLVFLIIFSFPLTPQILNNSLKLKKTFTLIDAHSLNIFFFLYICLLLSFTNIDIKIFFKIYFAISVLFLFFNYKKLDLKFNNSNLFSFFLFLLLIFSIFFYIAQNLKLEQDGHFWLEKALIFLMVINSSLKDVSTNAEYPHLGSYIWAFFWKNSFLELEYFGRYFQIYFYIIAIFLIVNNFNLNINLKIFSILFIVLITFEPYLFAGYQEYLIFISLIIASKYMSMIDFKNKANLKIVFLTLFILYITCWFKDEGVVYFIIFSTLIILFLNKSLTTKFNFLLFILLLLLLQYYLQKYVIGIHGFPHNNLSTIITELFNIKLFLNKIFDIFLGMLISFIKYPLWLLILFSIFLCLIFNKKLEKLNKLLLYGLILNLGFIFILFLSFGQESYQWYIKVTLDRLLFQTSGFYILLIVFALKNLKIIYK